MPKKIIIPNEILLARAADTVASGKAAIIPVKGNSMDPFITNGVDSVELHPFENLQIGDIVLALIENQTYILHRIFAFKGTDEVILMGDGNVDFQEHCFLKDIKGKAVFVINAHQKRIRLDSSYMRFAAKVWRILLPMRGILLRVYRKFIRKTPR